MAVKLTDVLKGNQATNGAHPDVRQYESDFTEAKGGTTEIKRTESRKIAELYYDLVTDFYEFGWGRSFHFAPRVPGESFKASLARHEHFLAHSLGLRPGMVAADIGCGVGGPLIEIARFSGAKIVGINANAYQLERARKLTDEAGLAHLAEFLHCDFADIDAPDNSFDAVYDIEATCHAPDKVSVYGEVFRVLKPGACFGAYEYCMTDRFDPNNTEHLRIKADIQWGGGLLEIDDFETVDNALHTVGFEVVEDAQSAGPTRSPGSLVRAAVRFRDLVRQLSQFEIRQGGNDAHAACARNAPHRPPRIGQCGAEVEHLRRRDGRGRPLGHLHADVLPPRAQARVNSSPQEPAP